LENHVKRLLLTYREINRVIKSNEEMMVNSNQLVEKNYSKLNADDPLSKAISLFDDTDVIMIFEDNTFQGALVKKI
jgi:hypothetical protein